jgi:hypothetical protein
MIKKQQSAKQSKFYKKELAFIDAKKWAKRYQLRRSNVDEPVPSHYRPKVERSPNIKRASLDHWDPEERRSCPMTEEKTTNCNQVLFISIFFTLFVLWSINCMSFLYREDWKWRSHPLSSLPLFYWRLPTVSSIERTMESSLKVRQSFLQYF